MVFREGSFKWKRYVALTVLTAVFIYFLFTGAISLFYAGAVIHPDSVTVSAIDKNLAYPYSSVSFKSRIDAASKDSVTLHGWHFNAKKTDRAMIIVHGFGGNRFPFGAETLDLIDALVAIDFNVLVFDLRNSGGSEAGVSAFGLHEKNDVLGAIDFMHEAGYERLALLGVSTGANTAAIAAAHTLTEDVGAIVLDSPITDMSEFILRLVRLENPKLPEFPFNYEVPGMVGLYLNGDIRDANLSKNLARYIPRPVLLIHGNNDEIVSMEDINAAYEDYMSRAVGKISIWHVPGAGHAECFSYSKDEYLERVTAFLQRVFI